MKRIEAGADDAFGIKLRQLLAYFGRAQAEDVATEIVGVDDLTVRIGQHDADGDPV